jgi:predicted TIM-barrel fold metal-dependent hydrolase
VWQASGISADSASDFYDSTVFPQILSIDARTRSVRRARVQRVVAKNSLLADGENPDVLLCPTDFTSKRKRVGIRQSPVISICTSAGCKFNFRTGHGFSYRILSAKSFAEKNMITVEGEKIEVIDAHSHMGARKKLAIHQIPPIMKFMAEDMLQSMDDAGVDGVVTFAIGIGEPSDYRETNQYIADTMKKHPDRIHGFMRLSPGNGPKDTLQVLEEGVKLGLKGIKIHPLIEHCPANDKEKVYPLMEAAQHHGLTVLFHCGLGEDASPKRIGEVAKDFPKLSIIMGHSGLVEGVRDVVEIAKKCENVHMDSSGVGWLPFFCESIVWAGPDRVLYGSDHPFNPMDWEIEKIVKHAQRHLKLKIEDLRLIMSGNIKRLLKIK